MRVTPVPHGLEDLLAKSGPRSHDKLHMSDIYKSLYAELEPDRFGRSGGPDPLRMELGLSMEAVLEESLAARLAGSGRPGELTTEHGIVYSPDWIIFNGATTVGELKLTWMSSREVPREPAESFPSKFNVWLTQVKLYCRALDTPHARLIAFFVNGDYDRKRPPGPELLAWDLEFSRRELEDEWALCMGFAKQKGMIHD